MPRAKPLEDARGDGDRADDPVDVATPYLQALEPVVCLVRGHPARERGEADPPRGNVHRQLVPELDRAGEEASSPLVASHVRVDRDVRAKVTEASNAFGSAWVLEQRHELVAESRRGEVTDEPHLDAPTEEARGVILEPKAVAGLVPNAAEDPRRVVDERQVVQDA